MAIIETNESPSQRATRERKFARDAIRPGANLIKLAKLNGINEEQITPILDRYLPDREKTPAKRTRRRAA